ncbi:MAG TPA: SDR family NAD(P)-dependent oxidoreductase [Candidatus Eisenbacteria bacterium]|nr:SDR family NAD(P)-dependent oxidoreductase [Candidatus Eisenbacteria bacterium]
MTDQFRLDGRVALVTGAGSVRGIGRAVAAACAGAGAHVALADLDGEGARRNAADLGDPAIGLPVDVTDPASVASATAEVRERLGPVDVLVCSAGITRGTPLWDISLEEFDRVLSVNVRGTFICLQAVLPDMRVRGWGRVIMLGSQAGKQGGGVFGSAHYACSKAALRGLCQGAARELGPFGVTCNVIAPGMVDTDIIVAGGATAEQVRELAERVAAATPSRRIARPDDIAAAALFLASDAAGQVTGEVLDVNGGAYFD